MVVKFSPSFAETLLIYSNITFPGNTELRPILFAHAVQAWANVVITQGIAQGVSNIGPMGHVRKQYWAKIVHNLATRISFTFNFVTFSLYIP